ncbi:hypothetical protein [Prevotellamassilia timonensis]|uniref:hypothetical protein n=1 Tax=Prevotellamassilia timonensis TaxID=1852370 RepID=UPI00307A2BD4
MKSYIKPQSTTINLDLRDSLLLNDSNVRVNATQHSDNDAALSQQKNSNSVWNSNLWSAMDNNDQ